MFTDFIIDYAKKGSHIVLDCTFPRNSEIAAISGGVAWFMNRVVLVESPGFFKDNSIQGFTSVTGIVYDYTLGYFFEFPSLREKVIKGGGIIGRVTSYFWVPEATTFTAAQFSMGCALATSFTLNMVALLIFGPKKNSGINHSLPEVLQKLGIGLKKVENAPAPVLQLPATPLPALLGKADKEPAIDGATNHMAGKVSNSGLTKEPASAELQHSLPNHQNRGVIKRRIAAVEQDDIENSAPEISSENPENIFYDDPLTKDARWFNYCC